MNLPLPPRLRPTPPAPPLPAFWHAVALCTPFDGAAVTVAEVWLDTAANVMRVLQSRLDGAYLDLLFARGQAWLLESVDGGPPHGIVGPFASPFVPPGADWFATLPLRTPGRGPLHGRECDWWVGLTKGTNPSNPDYHPAPTDQVANWFWFDTATALPLQMMFINTHNDYGLPVLGDFAKVTLSRSEAVDDPGLTALLAHCAERGATRPPASGAAIATPADRAGLFSSQPGVAARLLPGLRPAAPGDRLPVWPERMFLTSFSIATYDIVLNAPYPTEVYYDAGLSHMLTRMTLQDGSTEDCILDAGSTHVVRRWPDGRHRNIVTLPVGLPYRDWPARDGATVVAAIDGGHWFCGDDTLLIIGAPSTLGRTFSIWYTAGGVPVSFLEAPQCVNVQLVLTEYAHMTDAGAPFDPDLFIVPADAEGVSHGA